MQHLGHNAPGRAYEEPLKVLLEKLNLRANRHFEAGAQKEDQDSDSFRYYDLFDKRGPITHWTRSRQLRDYEEDSSSSSSSNSSGGGGSSSSSIKSISSRLQRPVLSATNNCIKLNANNSQGLDMLNLPSTAEGIARQKTWIQIYFRYRLWWHQAKPILQKVSKEDAYLPQNLKLWTRYVKVSLHRKVPFVNAVRLFRNRLRVPCVQVRYTLNTFYNKLEKERIRNPGPLSPIPLPLFRCPDDIPEFKKMPNAVINVFVTTDDSYFDEFWKECAQ